MGRRCDLIYLCCAGRAVCKQPGVPVSRRVGDTGKDGGGCGDGETRLGLETSSIKRVQETERAGRLARAPGMGTQGAGVSLWGIV